MSPGEIRKAMTRREFFAGIVPVFSIPVVFWWLLTGKRSELLHGAGKSIEISGSIPPGVSFHGDAVLINDGNTVRAFRARCTHLGCSIKKYEGDQLVCACHGSRFGFDGQVIQGPASEPLEELAVNTDTLGGKVSVTEK